MLFYSPIGHRTKQPVTAFCSFLPPITLDGSSFQSQRMFLHIIEVMNQQYLHIESTTWRIIIADGNSQTDHLLQKRHHSLAYRKTRILPCSTSPKGRFAMWCVRGCFNAAVTIAWCGYQRKVFVQLATVAVWMIVNRN